MNENYSLSPKDCIYISDLLSHTDSLIKKTSKFSIILLANLPLNNLAI